LKPKCTTAIVRKITRDLNEEVRDQVRALANTDAFHQSRRERKKVEMRFAHMKRILKLDRLRAANPTSQSSFATDSSSERTLRRFQATSAFDPGCVKTLRDITAPGILGSTVTRRAIALEVLQSSRAELAEHRVTTCTELASELPLISGHRRQLQQVISNLVQNAIEAMENTADRDRQLRVRTALHNRDAIIVAVEDSGP
jgi:signal transduction histidine kinase